MKNTKPLIPLLTICLILVMCITSCGSAGSAAYNNDKIPTQASGQSGAIPGGSQNDPSASQELLSEEAAIAIVLERVPGATSSDFISFEKEYDDGLWQYEGSLVYDGIEYSFEIDAQNGTLLDWEIED